MVGASEDHWRIFEEKATEAGIDVEIVDFTEYTLPNPALSEGELDCDRRELECWKHGSTFSLVTGEPSMLPATKPTPVYPVTIEGEDVYVEVPSP